MAAKFRRVEILFEKKTAAEKAPLHGAKDSIK